MYAIVKTGGKQYRVEEGQSLLVERLRGASDGSEVALEPLLFVDGSDVVSDGEGLAGVSVMARVVGQERGPKLRVVKFKPKRGYKRRNGHRQDLTRIEVTSIGKSGGGSGSAGGGSAGGGSGGGGGGAGRSRASSSSEAAAASSSSSPAPAGDASPEVEDGA